MKKTWMLIMSMLMAVMMVAGCGGGDKKAADNKLAQAPKVLRVGTEPTFAPFEFQKEGSKDFDGFDMDLIRAIGKQLNMKVEIQNMGFDALIPALNAGNIDVAASGMSITPDRQKAVDMSDPYYESGLSIVVRKGEEAKCKTPEELKGKTVAVQSGTTGEEKAKQLAGENVLSFKTSEETFQALKDKKAEAIVIDKPVARYLIRKQFPDAAVAVDAFATESYGIVMRHHGDLTPKINKALAELKSSGEYDKIYEKWFGKDTK